jgi:hypothetical protein
MKTDFLKMILAAFLLTFICGLASADVDSPAELTDNNMSDVYTVHAVDSSDFSTIGGDAGGVVFKDETVGTGEYSVTTHENNNSVTITATVEPEITSQTVGIPIYALSDEPDNNFDDNVIVTHFDDTGNVDWQKVEHPYIVGSVVYVDVQFSTVTITPFLSTVTNGNFETWSASDGTTPPTGWTAGTGGAGRWRNTGTVGSYAYYVSANGVDPAGWIQQNTTYAPGYYKVGCWVKKDSTTSGAAVIDLLWPSPQSAITAIAVGGNPTAWTWYETRVYNTYTNPKLRVWLWNTNNGGHVYFDGLVVSPDYSFTATETASPGYLYQAWNFTPSGVYSSATGMTIFSTYNLTAQSITSTTVKIDGNTVSSWRYLNYIYFDTSGLSAVAHNVNVSVGYTAPASYTITSTSALTQSVAFGTPLTLSVTPNQYATAYHFLINGVDSVSATPSLTHTFDEPGLVNITVYGENLSAVQSNVISYSVFVPRQTATAANITGKLDQTHFQPTMDAWLDMNVTGLATQIPYPFTTLIGNMFYLIIFAIPFIFVWINTGELTMPTVMFLVLGWMVIGFVPGEFHYIIWVAIAASIGGALYKLYQANR